MAEDAKGPSDEKAPDWGPGQTPGMPNRNPRVLIELDLATGIPVAKWENVSNFPLLFGLIEAGLVCIRETWRQQSMANALNKPMPATDLDISRLRNLRSGH